MLSEVQQKRLRDYFYGEGGDTFVLMSVDKMKKAFPDMTWKDVRDWYDSQEMVQVVRPAPTIREDERTGLAYKPIIAWYPFERLYIDTLFMKRYRLVIVVGLDLYSRYAFARVFYGDREQGISSKKALEALLEFLGEIKELGYTLKRYGAVWTDDGSEFKGAFKSYLKEKEVEQVVSKSGDARKNRNIERLNKTLRLLIEKWVVLYGKKISKKDIAKLVKGYNNSVHSSTGMTPHQALKDMILSRKLFEHYVDLKAGNKDKPEADILPVGTWVRWYIRLSSPFKKTGKNWSKTLYQVKSYDPSTKTYELDGLKKWLKRDYLQVVNKDLYDAYSYRPKRAVVEKDDREGRPPRKNFTVRRNKDLLQILNQPVIEARTRSGNK